MERINIAGAGIIGLSCAWRLAQQGQAVTVFDAREAAHEASWAGAGMLAPGGEFSEDTELSRLALRSLTLYPDYVRELEDESGIAIDFRRSGAIEVAYSDADANALSTRAALQARFGIQSETCAHQGRPARLYPDDATVDPRDITRALLAACRKRGVVVRENQAVLSVTADGAVKTLTGTHSGDAALVAAGAWSSALLSGLGTHLPDVVPVRGHLVSFPLPPGLLGPILRHGSTYLLQRRSSVLLAGTTKERVGFDRSLDDQAVGDILKRAAVLLPALAGEQPSERWNGFRPFVVGEIAVVERLNGTRVWAAYGHYRNGILLAPETASRVSQMFS